MLGGVDIGISFPDAAFGLVVAVAGIETHSVQVVYATVVAALQRSNFRRAPTEIVEVIGGGCGGRRFFADTGQNERVGGAFGGAPSLLGGVPKVARFKTFNGLRVDLSGVSEELYDTVLC